MNFDLDDPPDLLRRFSETPLYRDTFISGVEVVIRTNDERLMSMFPALSGGLVATLVCTAILDPAVPRSETQIIDDGVIRTVLLRDGVQMHFDRELRWISSFFAPDALAPMIAELQKGIAELWPRR